MEKSRTALMLAGGLLLAQLGVAQASPSHAPRGVDRGVGETVPVSWSISSENCSKLPDGVEITGEGDLTTVVDVTEAGGVTTVNVRSRGSGTAVDQDGNTYTWTYRNVLTDHQNSRAEPGLFSGEMRDRFRMAGDGPIELRSGFDVTFVEDREAETVGFYPRRAWGDSVDYPSGTARCDPL